MQRSHGSRVSTLRKRTVALAQLAGLEVRRVRPRPLAMSRSEQADVFAALAILQQRRLLHEPATTCDLRLSELRVFSQNGEDGVIEALIRALNVDTTYFVEFGVGDGSECNSRLLVDTFGWSGVYFEPDLPSYGRLETRHRFTGRVQCANEAITPANVNDLFEKFDVPERFGLLSIDIDGQDYWVWDALDARYRPDVVVVECNTGYDRARAVTESPGLPAPGAGSFGTSFGASVAALEKLAAGKGYRLVHVEQTGVNAFFARDELVAASGVEIVGITDRSPNHHFAGRGHPGDAPRPTVDLTEAGPT